ncbi:hypothetical protein H8E88_12825 [candidate division KSB1 bacterium]|nr:hypothetical protein [candidate division KSB1 bacterium]MBL7094849.1 hypothetical protein [candidate division KSB1 bacterium]
MWKILKAQISYNRIILYPSFLLTLAVIVPFIVQGWEVPEKSYPALRAVLFAMTAVIFLSSSVKNVKEKRDRFFHKLPLNLWELGAARLFFVLLFWFSLMVLVCITFVIRNSIFNYTYFWDLLSQTGFIIFMIGAVFFVRDIAFVFNFKNKKIFPGILNFVVIFGGYILFMFFVVSQNALDESSSLFFAKTKFGKFISSFPGAVLFLMIGSLTLFLSLFVFSRRKTFTE